MRKDFLQNKDQILKEEMKNSSACTCLWRQQGIRIHGRDTELSANIEVCRECGSPKAGQVPERNTMRAELATQGEKGGLGHSRKGHDINALVCEDRCVRTGVWGQVCGNRCLGTGVWGQVCRDRCVGTGVWGQV